MGWGVILFVVITLDRGIIERVDRAVHRWRADLTELRGSHGTPDDGPADGIGPSEVECRG